MMPFMSQPAVTSACYVADLAGASTQSQVFDVGRYLSRTWVESCTDCTRMFFSAVVHRTAMGEMQPLLNVHSGVNNTWDTFVGFDASDRLAISSFDGVGTFYFRHVSAQVFRDPAPLHVLVVIDTNAAAVDRIRAYANGIRITTWLTGNDGYPQYVEPTAGYQLAVGSTLPHRIGADVMGSTNLSGLLSSVDFGVGVAQTTGMDALAFGEFNIHGQWVHKAYRGLYGTHGAKLWFDQPLNPGHDVSGNGNHFSASGFDAAGADTVASSPTNVYATLSPLARATAEVLSDGNLKSTSGGTHDGVKGTQVIPAGVPIYAECTLRNATVSTSAVGFGVVRASKSPSDTDYGANGQNVWMIYSSAATWFGLGDGTTIAVGGASAAGAVFQVCIDLPNVWFGRNAVWYDSAGGTTGNPAQGLNPSIILPEDQFVFALDTYANGATVNFGQRPFAYTPPSGFKALCTDNLPKPAIKDPAEALAQVSATGADMMAVLDAATTTWWGGGYVEIVKRRDAAEDWRVRFSDDPGNGWAFNNPNPKAAAFALAATGDYVGHRLRVGRKYGVWTGEVAHITGTATTVTHDLGTARAAVIATRVSDDGGDRYLWHPDMTAGTLLKLNGTAQPAADGTLTGFAASSCQIAATAPSGTYRVLVLAERDGWLSLTRYVGNGVAADGAFVPMDIAPLLTITARTNADGNRYVNDAVRPGYNPTTPLALDSQNLDPAGGVADLDVGGVKFRNADSSQNASGGQYIIIAWGRPVGGVCVAPATAR